MRIKKEVLERILELCRQAYPNEIGGILLGKDVVRDFILLPGEYYRDSIYMQLHNLPIYPDAVGTFHSHPRGLPVPSQADLGLFAKTGREHLVIGWPYTEENVRAYDSRGRRLPLQVV